LLGLKLKVRRGVIELGGGDFSRTFSGTLSAAAMDWDGVGGAGAAVEMAGLPRLFGWHCGGICRIITRN
jgi:hypothetical protein